MGDLASAADLAVAIVLGLLQGLTEFFPVSSSAHLELVPWLGGWDLFDGDAELENLFDVVLHVGTLVGAALYLRNDIGRYAAALWRGIRGRPNAHTTAAVGLAVSAVPAALVGVILEDVVLDLAEEPLLIAALLAGFGWLLWWSDAAAARRGLERQQDAYGLRDAVAMGLAQAMALLPGVSRSGVTMTAGRRLGFDRSAAARLAFLMSLPIIAGAGLYRGATLAQSAPSAAELQLIAVGAAVAAVASWLGVAAMVRLLTWAGRRTQGSPFALFFGYRAMLAALVAVVAITGLR